MVVEMNFSTSHSFLGQRKSLLGESGVPVGLVHYGELLCVAFDVFEDQLLFVSVLREGQRDAACVPFGVLAAAQHLLVHLPETRLVQGFADGVAAVARLLLAQADPVGQVWVLVALRLLFVALERELEVGLAERVCGC